MTGLVLFAVAGTHFLDHALGLVGLQTQDGMTVAVRSTDQEHAMNPKIIEAGDYHVTCVGYPTANGKFRAIAKFERSADWKRHLEAVKAQTPMAAMSHRLEPEFASERAAVGAAVLYAKTTVGAGSVLWFDEADALFGKRSDVKDAHDRY